MDWESFQPSENENPFATPEMPGYDEIPKEFKDFNSRNKWNRLFGDMFFSGLSKLELKPKKGIDSVKAWNHLSSWARSFSPKHEHKTAAFAYMASIWFEDVKYETQ